MTDTKISQIRKREGSVVPFEPKKIETAIYKALMATRAGDKEVASTLARRVVEIVEDRFIQTIPGIEDVQDIVEKVLMEGGYPLS